VVVRKVERAHVIHASIRGICYVLRSDIAWQLMQKKPPALA
jgi:hypothetical protein